MNAGPGMQSVRPLHRSSHHTKVHASEREKKDGKMYLLQRTLAGLSCKSMRKRRGAGAESDKAETNVTESTMCIQNEECLSVSYDHHPAG
jgi:hypothetical protein